MFRLRYVFAASAAACLVAGVAAAQPAPDAQSPAPDALPPASQSQTTPAAPTATAASDAASQASAATTEPSSANVTVTVDASGVRHILVSSPPVPDTPDNRARYGGPMSHGGQHTQAAGN